MALADADLADLDRRITTSDQIDQAAKVHLQTISGANNLQKEIGTKAHILDQLFGPQCPLTCGFTKDLIPFIDNNFEVFERQVSSTTACTIFAYNVSRVEVQYYNFCITALSIEVVRDLVAVTPVSFQLLVDKLRWGRYKARRSRLPFRSYSFPATDHHHLAMMPRLAPSLILPTMVEAAALPAGKATPFRTHIILTASNYRLERTPEESFVTPLFPLLMAVYSTSAGTWVYPAFLDVLELAHTSTLRQP